MLWFGSRGYLTLSKAGFTLFCSFLQPPSLTLSLYPRSSVTSTWLARDIVALATGRISQPVETLNERHGGSGGEKSSVCNAKLAYKVTFTEWLVN